MVSAGWAWALPPTSKDRYLSDEREAIERKLGVHAHKCVSPRRMARHAPTRGLETGTGRLTARAGLHGRGP